MKKISVMVILTAAFASCSRGGASKTSGKHVTNGQIIPKEKGSSFVAERPSGMVAIPGGSFVMGMADKDFTESPEKAPLKTVTVSSFYMDESETTNAEYRVFINYVRDSIARTLLAEKAGDNASGTGIGQYAYKAKKANADQQSAYIKFLEEQGGRNGYDPTKRLDWSTPLYWNTSSYPDVEYAEVMESMYLPPNKRINDERILDASKLKYSYQYLDVAAAAKAKSNTKADLVRKENIAIYPDTTVWVRDFNYAYNDPLFQQYFWHKSYKNYPVVGVTWDQARAYCNFRTKSLVDYKKSKRKGGNALPMQFRLPTEAEWEYAAKGGIENATYPWGGPYLSDDRGCYLANFKPKRGSYIEDEKKGNYTYTAPVGKFQKNGFGLYDMAGNVSEWTESPYNNSTYQFSSTLNPNLSNSAYKEVRKSVRGGSWKDVGYLLMTGYRDWERKDSARSYIGFRTVQDIPEGSIRVKRSNSK